MLRLKDYKKKKKIGFDYDTTAEVVVGKHFFFFRSRRDLIRAFDGPSIIIVPRAKDVAPLPSNMIFCVRGQKRYEI